MANKQKKKRNKKYRPTYVTGGRVDMSKGGRVKAQVGGKFAKAPVDSKKTPTMSIERKEEVKPTVQPKETTKTIKQAPVESKRPNDVVQTGTNTNITPQETFIENVDTAANNINTTFTKAPEQVKKPNIIEPKGPASEEFITNTTTKFNVGDTRTLPNGKILQWDGKTWITINDPTTEEIIDDIELTDEQKETKFQSDRKTRILETAEQAQQMAQGIMPEDIPTIPDPKRLISEDGQVAEGTEITPEEAGRLQMEATKQAEAAKVAAVSPEQVSTIQDVATAAAPKPFEIATIGDADISKVPEDAVVEAATGSVSPEVSETLAKAAGIERVAPIDAAEVEVIPGALQERVVGTISKEAKAEAAKVAGTSLAKITRAKKQLRNAGLSEDEIAEIGNDPEDLEARLIDFTEEQRGIIEGLPEEALVSTQINGLLEGMEKGEIPMWARPAVASVEAMLAQRGMSASTVGRDALLNAIMTSALPIAQSNAQAIQASVSQQKSIEATAALKDAEMAQQTALFNAQNVFQLDMAQFSADQQRAINNSKFLQTASLQNATASQQAVMQDAIIMSQMNLAEADQNTKLAITNAQAFLQMDMANLNNKQQASMLKAQQIQQRLLSNQSAENAAAQFNATSQNQVNQFMANLSQQNEQYNTSQLNAMKQFNAQQENAAEARRVGREAQAEIIEAQLKTDVEKFNAQQEFAREQFNTQNATAIAQSNVEWRRKANTADTAAFNAITQKNAQNMFQLTAAANNFLWQELRDEADFEFKRWDNDQQRKASLLIAALGNEAGVGKQDVWDDSLKSITSILNGWLDG
jgi:hypothetical protein